MHQICSPVSKYEQVFSDIICCPIPLPIPSPKTIASPEDCVFQIPFSPQNFFQTIFSPSFRPFFYLSFPLPPNLVCSLEHVPGFIFIFMTSYCNSQYGLTLCHVSTCLASQFVAMEIDSFDIFKWTCPVRVSDANEIPIDGGDKSWKIIMKCISGLD